MPELGTYGSVRGVPSNGHPYRDRCAARTGRLAVDNAHALPTAPAFAHKLHSLLPPSTTRTQSPSEPGSIGAATILTRGGGCLLHAHRWDALESTLASGAMHRHRTKENALDSAVQGVLLALGV